MSARIGSARRSRPRRAAGRPNRSAPGERTVGDTRSSRRSFAGAALLVLVWALGVLVVPSAGAAGPPVGPGDPIDLTGEGASAAGPLSLQWADAFDTSTRKVLPDYVVSGEAQGRRSFLEGRTDFLVSGEPLGQADLDALSKGRGAVGMPIQGTGTSVLMSGPWKSFGDPGGFDVCPNGEYGLDPDTFDTGCVPPGNGGAGTVTGQPVGLRSLVAGYPGPSLRLGPLALIDSFFNGAGPWAEDQFIRQPTGGLLVPGVGNSTGTVRTDASAPNLYLQEYLQAVAPGPFADAVKATVFEPDKYVPSERWPTRGATSRDGNANVVSQVSAWLDGGGNLASKGALALADIQSAREALDIAASKPPTKRTDLWIAELQNANGDWVLPSGESLTKAFDAGGAEPLYAATHPVPGGWPLAWVDTLYAPERGLSADKANALAAIVRYQSTTGADRAAEIADGKLPQALRTQALEGADKMLRSNCADARGTVVETTDPGALVPAGSTDAFAALGVLSWCVPAATAAAAPTTAPAAVVPAASGGGSGTPAPVESSNTGSGSASGGFTPSGGSTGSNPGSSGSSATTGQSASATVSADPGSTGSGATATGGATGVAAKGSSTDTALVSAKLPLPLPGSGRSGMDFIATAALGAALFLVVRGIWRSPTVRQGIGLGP